MCFAHYRLVAVVACGAMLAGAARGGVPPETPWACPTTHPIKGYVSSDSGRVYFVPQHRFYEEASPERCYASEREAQQDGGRPARDLDRRRSLDGVI